MLTSEEPYYLILTLDDGQPRVILSHGSDNAMTSSITLYGVTVSDGEWHSIVFSKLGL